MAHRMTTTPAESGQVDESFAAPVVRILLVSIKGADMEAALSIVSRQVYEPQPEIVVVGSERAEGGDHVTYAGLEQAIVAQGNDVDYLWILHSDARPRPDALAALVYEVGRNDASLGGSKLLVAGSRDELESVGSATDVFGEAFSGLDEGEIDLQQYDVVREVAFVRSASMLVRRDLAQGLRGLDELLPPVAAGLDFSQRTRLAGGRVISVPSSEVYHQGRCGERGRSWREQAGRLRAMLTAYRLLTLLWLVPYDLMVAVVDSVASLLLLRWRPAISHLLSWLWNLVHLPSTIGQRMRFATVRIAGDEELFRFQSRGSVRLREVGSEITVRLLSMFDDDQAIVRGSQRLWSAPGVWAAVIAMFAVLVSARSIIFGGVPETGFNFPFDAPSVALDRWLAGWNQAGLGTPAAVHPSAGPTGLASWIWFGAEGAARTILTVAFGLLAVAGMGRLGGRLGLSGPGRYLAGLVLISGPGVGALARAGSWLALAGAALLPWLVRASLVRPRSGASTMTAVGWSIVFGVIVASFSPVLVLVPLLVWLVYSVLGGEGRSLWAAVAALAGFVAALPFFLGDTGWFLDDARRLGLSVDTFWPFLIAGAALPLALVKTNAGKAGLSGGLIGSGAMAALAASGFGPGVEEALLIVASFGAALVVVAGLDAARGAPVSLLVSLLSIVAVVISLTALGDGNLGLAAGEENLELGFSETLAGPGGPGRTLVASTDPGDIPGESRSGPGFWYRVVDGQQITLDQVWLGEPLSRDAELAAAVDAIATGAELRPGQILAPFAVDWVVLRGEEFALDTAFLTQVDLVPTPLDPEARVFENLSAAPLAGGPSGDPWVRDGSGFAGQPANGRVRLSLNHGEGWGPDGREEGGQTSVSATTGVAEYGGAPSDAALSLAGAAALIIGFLLVALRRRRS